MITVLAANDFGDNLGDGVAGPVGLLIIVLLVVALVFLMRSMNKHLRRVRDEFPDDATVARMNGYRRSAGSDAPNGGSGSASRDADADRGPVDAGFSEPGGNLDGR
jgi:hypothetical protein